MGTRINVIVGNSRKESVVLFANSHHPDVDLDSIIVCIAEESGTDEEFAMRILDEVYPTDFGLHVAGTHIFTTDLLPGDHEKVFAVHGYSAPLSVAEFGSDFDWKSDEPLFVSTVETELKTKWQLLSDKDDKILDYKSEFGDLIGYDTRIDRIELSVNENGFLQKGVLFTTVESAMKSVDDFYDQRRTISMIDETKEAEPSFKVGDEVEVSHTNYRGDVDKKIVVIERILPCDDTKTNIWTSDGHAHFSTECKLHRRNENEPFSFKETVDSLDESQPSSGPKIG